MAVDTFGGWHPTALDIITKLGRQLARNVGKLDEEVVAHLCGSDWGYFWFGTTWQCSVLGHPLSLQQQQSMEEMIVNLSKSFFPAIVSFTTFCRKLPLNKYIFPSLLTSWLVMNKVQAQVVQSVEETKVQQHGFEVILLLIAVEKLN